MNKVPYVFNKGTPEERQNLIIEGLARGYWELKTSGEYTWAEMDGENLLILASDIEALEAKGYIKKVCGEPQEDME